MMSTFRARWLAMWPGWLCLGACSAPISVLLEDGRDAGMVSNEEDTGSSDDADAAIPDLANADAHRPDTAGRDASACEAHTPVAPSDGIFMWQGTQRHFRDIQAEECEGLIAFGIGPRAVCYVGADNSLRCAGRIGERIFGPDFVDLGAKDVDQVLLSPSNEGQDGLCVHKSDGTVWCLGSYNHWGQYGLGGTTGTSTLMQWGDGLYTFTGIATGNWDQICAVEREHSEVYCAGYNYGLDPTSVGFRSRDDLWVDKNGFAQLDAYVDRVSNVRTECRMEQIGLVCGNEELGPPGYIVDGGRIQSETDRVYCWLTSLGHAGCTSVLFNGTELFRQHFDEIFVLALATNYDTDSVCAVADDGSLWCMGSNDEGKLGTGDTQPLLVETMVQPPGSVMIRAPRPGSP